MLTTVAALALVRRFTGARPLGGPDMPKHTQRIVGLPIGSFRPDPTLARTTKGSGRGHNAKTQDAKIREIVARERAKREQA
jgi:hypothetical protein